MIKNVYIKKQKKEKKQEKKHKITKSKVKVEK